MFTGLESRALLATHTGGLLLGSTGFVGLREEDRPRVHRRD
jgi:hypothetical protein